MDPSAPTSSEDSQPDAANASMREFEREDKSPTLDAPYAPPPDRTDIPIEYKLFALPVLVLLGKFILPIAERWIAAIRFPYQIDGEEGFILHQALSMYLGDSIYQPITQSPYLVGNYPPLAPWIISMFVRPQSFGLELGRLVVMEFAILSVALIALTVGFRTRRLVCAGIAAVIFMASYEFHQWSAFCRVDFPALAFTLAGLCLFLNSRTRTATVVSAVLFVAAGFARQTAFLAPLACMIGLLIHDRRRLMWFAIPYVAIGLIALFALNVTTDGEFVRHTIFYNRNVMDWGSWRAVMRNEIGYFYARWIMALIAGGTLCAMARLESDSPHEENGAQHSNELPHARGVVGIYAMLATLSLVSFAKVGSAPNYALEPLAAWAIFGGVTLGRLFDMGGGAVCKRRMWARLGAAVMCGFILLHGLHLGMPSKPQGQNVGDHLVSSRNPNESDHKIGMEVLASAQAANGPVLSELPIFTLLAGRDVIFQPFILSQLAEEGKWDENLFLKMLDEKKFALIITTQDLRTANEAHIWRFTPRMVNEILRRYELHAVIGGPQFGALGQSHFLWRPKLNSKPTASEKKELEKISGVSGDPSGLSG